MAGRPRLRRGDLLPRIVTPPPGPSARRLAEELASREAPGVDTLAGGARPVVWDEALGANVLDTDGNRYLDLTGGFGVAAIGHRHPEVVAAIRRQSARLLHGLGDLHAHPARIELAGELAKRAPFADARVYFAVSGSDAVEIALKTALLATGRPGILAFRGGYHGLSLGALAVTGMPRFRVPFEPHLHPWVRHEPWGEIPRAAALPVADLAAVIVEPIQGRGGVRVAPPGWLAEVASFAAHHGALLILDEVLTGGGRTGVFWAGEADGVEPDLLLAGKALGGGLPLGAVLGSRRVLEAWPADAEALHSGTFLAHPLACAASLATLPVIDRLLADPKTGDRAVALAAGLSAIAERFPERVLEARGRGHLHGLVLRRPGAALRLAALALGRGLLVLPSGIEGDVLELLPPLTLTDAQIGDALARLADAVGALAR